MQGAHILIGAALLLFGRRLFWLFVGGVGFIVGFDLASRLLTQQPEWLLLLIGVGVGLLGAIASIFLQRLVVGIAGFFAGGYFASALAVGAVAGNQAGVALVAFLAGGIVGAILVVALLDPALILLSSLVGATAICENLVIARSTREILFFAMVVIGIIVQAAQYWPTRKRRPVEQAQTQ